MRLACQSPVSRVLCQYNYCVQYLQVNLMAPVNRYMSIQGSS